MAILNDEPAASPRKIGPQYVRGKPDQKPETQNEEGTRKGRPMSSDIGRTMASFRNGDRALVIAVNDCGNIGWVRYARTDYSAYPVV